MRCLSDLHFKQLQYLEHRMATCLVFTIIFRADSTVPVQPGWFGARFRDAYSQQRKSLSVADSGHRSSDGLHHSQGKPLLLRSFHGLCYLHIYFILDKK